MAGASMDAWQFVKYGSPSQVLYKKTLDIPTPQKGFVLVKVEATCTNPLDVKVLHGMNPNASGPSEPCTIGWDGAGIVVDASQCTNQEFSTGERVMWMGSAPDLDLVQGSGTFAQYACVDQRILGKAPSAASMVQAASLPLCYMTARTALEQHLNAQRNEAVLIVNGAGGVGSYATQIAHNLGCTVIATASRKETSDWCRQNGAHHVIDHKQSSFTEALQAAGFSPGAVKHALLCAPPEKMLSNVFNSLGPNGRCTSILPYSNEALSGIDFFGMFTQQKGLLQTAVLERTMMLEKHKKWLDEAAQLVDSGKIKPAANALYNFDELPQALEHQESGKAIGKICVKISVQ